MRGIALSLNKTFTEKSKFSTFPIVNFINILRAHFFVKNFGAKNYKAAQSTFVQNFGAKNMLLNKNCVRKMLMKLTPNPRIKEKFGHKSKRLSTVTFTLKLTPYNQSKISRDNFTDA